MGSRPKAFEALSKRLHSPPATPATEEGAAPDRPSTQGPLRILGVDPSLRGTGFGVIRASASQMSYLEAGTIKCAPKWAHSRCLHTIFEGISDVIQRQRPEVCVVEGLFFAKNSKTALIMGQARGASIVAASRTGIPVYEIAARKVKQAIVGFGGAQKLAVAKMVERMLSLDHTPAPDAGDALALAMTFSLESRSPAAKPIHRI